MAKEMGDFEEIKGKSREQQRGQFVVSRQTKVTSHRAQVQIFQCGRFASRLDLPRFLIARVVPGGFSLELSVTIGLPLW